MRAYSSATSSHCRQCRATAPEPGHPADLPPGSADGGRCDRYKRLRSDRGFQAGCRAGKVSKCLYLVKNWSIVTAPSITQDFPFFKQVGFNSKYVKILTQEVSKYS